MSNVIDNIVVVLFVLFLIYIFRGYHLSKLEKYKEDEEKKDNLG